MKKCYLLLPAKTREDFTSLFKSYSVKIIELKHAAFFLSHQLTMTLNQLYNHMYSLIDSKPRSMSPVPLSTRITF